MDDNEQVRQVQDLLAEAVNIFNLDRASKSFGDRHPELGKMIKCQVCNTRHRGMPCVPVYAKGEDGRERMCQQHTNKGIYGAAKFKGRILKHRNKRGLQDLELALLLYRKDYEPFFSDKETAGKEALIEAVRINRGKRRARKRSLRLITEASRRRNRV